MVHNNLKRKVEIISGFSHASAGGCLMDITLHLDPGVVLFYSRIASSAGLPLEQVLADALFKLAGELSLQALQKGKQ